MGLWRDGFLVVCSCCVLLIPRTTGTLLTRRLEDCQKVRLLSGTVFVFVSMLMANRCYDEGRALVICANKRDCVAALGISARQYEKVGDLCLVFIALGVVATHCTISLPEQGVRAHCDALMKYFGEIPIVSTAAAVTEQTLSAARNTSALAMPSSKIAVWDGSGSEGMDRCDLRPV